VDAHLLGVVLNMVPAKSGMAYGYGYGYGYVADKPVRTAGVRARGSRHMSDDTSPVPIVRGKQSVHSGEVGPAHQGQHIRGDERSDGRALRNRSPGLARAPSLVRNAAPPRSRLGR